MHILGCSSDFAETCPGPKLLCLIIFLVLWLLFLRWFFCCLVLFYTLVLFLTSGRSKSRPGPKQKRQQC